MTWDLTYQGVLCYQGLDTLSRKIRALKAEITISYLTSASFSQTCERFTLSGHQNRSWSLAQSGGPWEVKLSSVLQVNFDFSSCSLLFSLSKWIRCACCRTFLHAVKWLHHPAPELSAFQRETEFLPAPAAALSPCTHRSLPDCTESTKEKEETGSSTGICLVYKASLAEFPMRLGQRCQAVPALLCCRARGRAE